MATKLRDRGNLSAAQQEQIRGLLKSGKTIEEVAADMKYLPKYLQGRIAFHGLDGKAPAAAPKPKAKPNRPGSTLKAPLTKPAAMASPRDIMEEVLERECNRGKIEIIDQVIGEMTKWRLAVLAMDSKEGR